MNPKYELYDTQSDELIPSDKGQCYADDNTVVFGGYLGQLQNEGRLGFREIILTPEEIKHQQKVALNNEYSIIYDNLNKGFAARLQRGENTSDISAMRIQVIAEHKSRKEAIDNG
jgi:hypothetical protein